MNSQNWAENDINRGIDYLQDHEEEASTATILSPDNEITILLPYRLPAYGANITGIFMMAPILLFICIMIFFSMQILWSANGHSINKVVISTMSLLLAWGLGKVLQLMLKNRDLFPRCYFVTLGSKGIAMHFTRFHFPFHPPRMAIAWKDIQTLNRIKNLFFPALLLGNPWITTIEVISTRGEKILIPFRLPKEKSSVTADKIESLISQKINQ